MVMLLAQNVDLEKDGHRYIADYALVTVSPVQKIDCTCQ